MNIQLLLAQVLLMACGLMAVATARPDLILDHGGKLLAGLVVTFVVARIPPAKIVRAGPVLWVGSVILLMLVLVIGVGTAESSATKRWIDIGPVRFQPSEMGKLSLVIMLASFFSRRGVENKLLSAAGMIMITTALIMLEPDMGTTFLTFFLGVVVMYAAGVRITNIWGFAIALALCAAPFGSVYLQRHPYILERFQGHQNRDEGLASGLDQIGMAHRDLIAGGLWGRGPDGLRYEYFAAHTDMVIATVGFASGLLGVAIVFLSYWMIVSSGLQVSRMAARIRPMTPNVHAASILATGAMFMVVGQAMVNLAVAGGVMPVTGVTLPLVSYGFSSIMVISAALGIIHSCMREIYRHGGLPAPADEVAALGPPPAPLTET